MWHGGDVAGNLRTNREKGPCGPFEVVWRGSLIRVPMLEAAEIPDEGGTDRVSGEVAIDPSRPKTR
jgi:hypothetical protein